MTSNVNFSIAKVHLLSRKRQTLIVMLGVTFGIAMFILMISFMKGTNKFLQEAMLSSTPDIRIHSDAKTDYSTSIAKEYYKKDSGILIKLYHAKPENVNPNLKNVPAIINSLRKNKEVMAVSPVLSTNVFFNYGTVQLNGIVDGVNITEELKLYNLADKMVTGKAEDLQGNQNGIILGEGIADKMNLRLGDAVTLVTSAGIAAYFKIVGIFKFGIGTIDNVRAYINIASAQRLINKSKDYYTDIRLKLIDMDRSKSLASIFSKQYQYKAEDWEDANSSIRASNIVRNVLTYVVSIALLIVAGFGIYNMMNMTVTSKLKDIAILKTEGFTGKDIITIFSFQSVTIGLLGSLLGIIIGYILSYFLSKVPFPRSDLINLKFFPVLFEIKYYVFGVLFGLFTAFIAGLMPALKASKLDPIAIMRGI